MLFIHSLRNHWRVNCKVVMNESNLKFPHLLIFAAHLQLIISQLLYYLFISLSAVWLQNVILHTFQLQSASLSLLCDLVQSPLYFTLFLPPRITGANKYFKYFIQIFICLLVMINLSPENLIGIFFLCSECWETWVRIFF